MAPPPPPYRAAGRPEPGTGRTFGFGRRRGVVGGGHGGFGNHDRGGLCRFVLLGGGGRREEHPQPQGQQRTKQHRRGGSGGGGGAGRERCRRSWRQLYQQGAAPGRRVMQSDAAAGGAAAEGARRLSALGRVRFPQGACGREESQPGGSSTGRGWRNNPSGIGAPARTKARFQEGEAPSARRRTPTRGAARRSGARNRSQPQDAA